MIAGDENLEQDLSVIVYELEREESCLETSGTFEIK